MGGFAGSFATALRLPHPLAQFVNGDVSSGQMIEQLPFQFFQQNELIRVGDESLVAVVIQKQLHRVVELAHNKVDRFLAEHDCPLALRFGGHQQLCW
jgi:hypothetical protein